MNTEAVNNDALNTLFAALGAAAAVIVVIALVWVVLNIAATWRIFTKAGEGGWKSLIPIYNSYVLYDKVWSTVWFWVTLVLNAVVFYTQPQAVAEGASMTALQMVGAVCMVAGMVLYILLNYKTAKAFGKGIGYTLGLIFLQPIFLMMLGFGSAQYQGPQ